MKQTSSSYSIYTTSILFTLLSTLSHADDVKKGWFFYDDSNLNAVTNMEQENVKSYVDKKAKMEQYIKAQDISPELKAYLLKQLYEEQPKTTPEQEIDTEMKQELNKLLKEPKPLSKIEDEYNLQTKSKTTSLVSPDQPTSSYGLITSGTPVDNTNDAYTNPFIFNGGKPAYDIPTKKALEQNNIFNIKTK